MKYRFDARRLACRLLAGWYGLWLILFLPAETAVAESFSFSRIYNGPAAPENTNVFASNIAYDKGAVFIVAAEPGAGRWLSTVIHKGSRNQGQNEWQWQSRTIDGQTIPDRYHTTPSIGIDENGYLHIAYNMHNMPWQYVISGQPGAIDSFRFRGQAISTLAKLQVAIMNRTPFKGPGSGLIPGNQITYPAFFNDRLGQLYVTYRFALRPARPFADRMLSAGIARYDAQAGAWYGIGADWRQSRADLYGRNSDGGQHSAMVFAADEGWTVYLPRLLFDRNNGMHVFWQWRKGIPGRDVRYPSYAFSPDAGETFYRSTGERYRMPITVDTAEKIVRQTTAAGNWPRLYTLMKDDQNPSVLLQGVDGGRRLVTLDRTKQHWRQDTPPPRSATAMLTDCHGREWAIATGPVLVRRLPSSSWRVVEEYPSADRYRYPSLAMGKDRCEYFVSMQSLDERSLAVFHLLIRDAG